MHPPNPGPLHIPAWHSFDPVTCPQYIATHVAVHTAPSIDPAGHPDTTYRNCVYAVEQSHAAHPLNGVPTHIPCVHVGPPLTAPHCDAAHIAVHIVPSATPALHVGSSWYCGPSDHAVAQLHALHPLNGVVTSQFPNEHLTFPTTVPVYPGIQDALQIAPCAVPAPHPLTS